MCSACLDACRSHILECVCSVGYGSCRIYHIIHQDTVLALDVSDDIHYFALVRLRSSLVYDSDRGIQRLCHISRSRNASVVRRNYYHVFQVLLLEISCQYRHSHQMVHRYIEISLYLCRMKIQGQHSVGSRRYKQICNKLGRDRISCLGLSVLSCISVIKMCIRDRFRDCI